MIRTVFVVSVAAVAAGCGESRVSGNTCSTSDDCDPGWACVANECLKLCNHNSQCPPRNVCTTGVCVLTNDGADTGEACQVAEDCVPGHVCHLSECLRYDGVVCAHPDECRSGYCADGFCCESECTDACRNCAETPGVCEVSTDDDEECDDDDPCTRDSCVQGACVSITYEQGERGDCAPGLYCCGTPLTCEGSSTVCPGAGASLFFGSSKLRFASLAPGRTFYVY